MDTSAEARIVASFVFIAALLFGGWSAIEYLVAGPPSFLPSEDVGRVLGVLVPVAATAVAFQAATQVQERWARTLGSATVMLGVAASTGAVLWLLGTLTNGY
ncbi:MAG: hypothetical protein ACO1ON_15540 [Nocardioides sp.]|uniref:hypothetical protein n=1 Tax=Nocardioides sp. TaxID=35761 RepID=UPI00261FE164|nr:hypothetical protein [Nocardioides sp.]